MYSQSAVWSAPRTIMAWCLRDTAVCGRPPPKNNKMLTSYSLKSCSGNRLPSIALLGRLRALREELGRSSPHMRSVLGTFLVGWIVARSQSPWATLVEFGSAIEPLSGLEAGSCTGAHAHDVCAAFLNSRSMQLTGASPFSTADIETRDPPVGQFGGDSGPTCPRSRLWGAKLGTCWPSLARL